MNQLLTQLKQLWDKQPKGRRLLAIAVLLGVIAVVAITTLTNHAPEWVSVSEGASPDDASELMSVLQQGGVNARLNTGKVEVAKADFDKAMSVARAAGLPRTGKGMELFDGSNLGQSSFAEQINYVRALEGELARSVSSLAQVQGARVHLAMGTKSVFKDQAQPPTASVALHLHAGQTLTGEQVRGVRQLVAAGVAGMAADSVVVVDSHGNLLDSAAPGTADQKATIEQTVATRVRNMLERVVGAGKVSVVATATVDERKVSETQEVYDAANPAIRSETRTVDGAGALDQGLNSGVAGVRGNLPGAPAATTTPAPGAGSGASGHVQETKNYELSRTVRQTTKPDVQLAKLQLAVVVDYKAGTDGKPAPRTDKELAELTALARQAAGIDDTRGDKIEVRSIAFAPDPEQADAAAAAAPVAAAELPIIPIAAGAGGLVLLVIIALVIKSRRAKKKAANKPLSLALPAPISELERVLDAKSSNDPMKPDIAGAIANAAPGLPPGRPVRERVLDAVRDDLDRTAEVLTAWLAEGQPKGAKS